MTLYTPQVREYVLSRDWPKGLQLDIFEDVAEIYGLETPHLNFVFYRDNWLTLKPEQHLKAANIIKEVLEKLRSDGIPCYMAKMESRHGQ